MKEQILIFLASLLIILSIYRIYKDRYQEKRTIAVYLATLFVSIVVIGINLSKVI